MNKLWHDFELEKFEFEGVKAIHVFPKENDCKKLALKTEYWGAYPDIEIKLLENGFHLAYVENISRFATRDDCSKKARFVKFLSQKYDLQSKCIPIGMSLGGAHAFKFGCLYPELVSVIFLDAPVLNFCSFPGKIGNCECEKVWENEFIFAYPDIKRYQLVNFSEHPISFTDSVINNRIPVIMVYGEEDRTVIYEENGKLLEQALENTGLLSVLKVPFRGHHPHGMIGNNNKIVELIIEKASV